MQLLITHPFSAFVMAARIALTDRDNELLKVLVAQLRCLSVNQVAESWWTGSIDPRSAAEPRLRLLEQAGWLVRTSVLARPIPELTAPVAAWQPGAEMPDFGPVSYHLRHRFTNPVIDTPIVVATQTAANRFGGQPGRCPRRSEATHDLGLASVFLHFRRKDPDRASRWIGETSLTKTGGRRRRKIPDALIRDADGSETVIEFGGEYEKAKLEAFHEECVTYERSYEIW